jgi:hypothetical protein
MSVHIILYEVLRSLWRNVYLFPRLLIVVFAVYISIGLIMPLVKSMRSGVLIFDRDGHYNISFRNRPGKFIAHFVLFVLFAVLSFMSLGAMCIFYYLDVVNHLNGAP